MASICNEKDGTRRIALVDQDGRHRSLRLGKCSKKAAETFRLRIEQLVHDRKFGVPHEPATADWLAKLPDGLHERLVRLGLASPRSASTTLGELIERFLDAQHVKEATLASYKQCTDSLIRELGADTPLDRITAADADRWKVAIARNGRVREKEGPRSLSNATVAKRTNIAKAIFAKAKVWKLIDENPFAHLKRGSQVNAARSRYISTSDTEAVLKACPDIEWQTLIGLARYAGLRCPSEVRELLWTDVDWSRKLLVVRSPKTAGSPNGAVRKVPVSPALQPLLWQLRQEAPSDATHVIKEVQGAARNLRTRFRRIIKRAGLEPWPRLFQNLRASCATDFAQTLPIHEASRFLGHTPLIAASHYLQASDHNFRSVAGDGPWLTQVTGDAGVPSGVQVAYKSA